MHIFHIAYKNGRNSKMYSHPKEKERRQKEESLFINLPTEINLIISST